MLKKNIEKMERLFSVEASIANIYQKLMQLEKENKKNSKVYKENFTYLELIQPIEHRLVREIYEEMEIEDILEIFSDVVEQDDILMHVTSFSKMFDVRSRVIQMFMDYHFKEAMDTTTDDYIVNHSKTLFIYEQVILKNLIALANMHSEENFYREVYLTLKYNGIYTYANLLENAFETNFATSKDIEHLCFTYRLPYKQTEEEIVGICIKDLQSFLQEWKKLANSRNIEFYLENSQINPEFDLQFMYDKIGAYLMIVDENSYHYLQDYLETLNVNDYEKSSIYSLFNSIKASKILLEPKNKHAFVKKNLLSSIEFYNKN
jgi:hypothetical protein